MFLLNFFAHYLPPQRYNFFFIYPNKTSKTVKLFLITLKIFVYLHFLLYLCARLGTHSNYYICLLLLFGLKIRVVCRSRSRYYLA